MAEARYESTRARKREPRGEEGIAPEKEVLLTDTLQSSRDLALRCARLLDEKKLQDITIFDVERSIQITDYFVLASGLNSRHLRSASDFLVKELRQESVARMGLEGYREGKWILVDFSDVIVHLFLAENRRYYDLELLWGDCPRVDWSAERRPAAAGG
jgi:ribosome-associated protein